MSRCFIALPLVLSLQLAAAGASDSRPTSVLPAEMNTTGSEKFQRLVGQHGKIGELPLTREQIHQRFVEQSVFKGTFLKTQSSAEPQVFVEIASAILKQNPCPPERRNEFAYVLDADNLAVIKWIGLVRKIAREANGTYSMLMDVQPEMIARGGGVVFTPYFCAEHWTWDGRDLKFQKLVGAQNGIKAVFID